MAFDNPLPFLINTLLGLYLCTLLLRTALQVSRADDVFDANGTLVDTRVREQLKKYLAGFCQFVTSRSK